MQEFTLLAPTVHVHIVAYEYWNVNNNVYIIAVTQKVVCNVTTVQLQTLDITLGKRWSFHKRYYVRTMPSCTEG